MTDAMVARALREDAADGAEATGRKGRKQPLLIADLFCGAGGFSTGAMRAIKSAGREGILTCVNHWSLAIQTHQLNHPEARHFCADLSAIRPIVAVPEGRLDLLLASPSCVFHSRARGGRPMEDQQRMDPWFIIQWLTELRVKRLIIENVPEFVQWGPINIKTGRPMASRQGEYFKSWCRTIEGLGFKIKFKTLVCADYGDATTRERFFLVARSDGKAPEWPVPTHSRTGSTDLFGAGAKRWRSAAEVIDWDHKGRSIYGRKKSLSSKTLLRIFSGTVRYEWHRGYQDRLERLMLEQGVDPATIEEVRSRSRPNRRSRASVASFVLNRHGENGSVRVHPVTDPMPTADCRGAGYLVEGFLATVSHGMKTPADTAGRVQGIEEPLRTIHAGGSDFALVQRAPPTFMLSQASGGQPRTVEAPVPTIAAAGAVALIAPFYGSGSGDTCKGVDVPLDTITSKARFAVVEAARAEPGGNGGSQPIIVPQYGRSASKGIDSPLDAITGKQHLALVMPLTHAGPGQGRVRDAGQPLPTITGANRGELGFITTAFGEREGQLPRTHDASEPMPTICAQGTINVVQPSDCEPFDILFRMLEPRELSRATSMDTDAQPYLFAGNSKTHTTKLIGNAVPSSTAQALVAALL